MSHRTENKQQSCVKVVFEWGGIGVTRRDRAGYVLYDNQVEVQNANDLERKLKRLTVSKNRFSSSCRCLVLKICPSTDKFSENLS
jgi:hypothetical protein